MSQQQPTGARPETSAANWMRIKAKDGKLMLGDSTIGGFDGYLTHAEMKYDQGNKEYNIDPHWKLNLQFNVPNEELPYRIDIPMPWKSIAPNFVNAILGAPSNWDGYFYFRIYKKDEHTRVFISTEAPGEKRADTKILWDSDNNRFSGQPESVFVGKVKGKDIYDDTAVIEWWVKHAVDACTRVNAGEVYVLPPTGTAPAATASAPSTGNKITPAQFTSALVKKLDAVKSVADLMKLHAGAYASAADFGVKASEVDVLCNALLPNFGMKGNFASGTYNETTAGPADDLPF